MTHLTTAHNEPDAAELREQLDLLAGGRRLMRVTIPGADPRGRLVDMEVSGSPDASVPWRNRDGTLVARSYRVGAQRLVAQ